MLCPRRLYLTDYYPSFHIQIGRGFVPADVERAHDQRTPGHQLEHLAVGLHLLRLGRHVVTVEIQKLGAEKAHTFRPDAVVNIDAPGWSENIELLSEISGIDVRDYATLVQALEQRRAFFKDMGATATDHAATSAYTAELSAYEAEVLFQRALVGNADAEDARQFTGHMLMEMARMSIEDGLVMQFHAGSFRNHNQA
ncbi:MAG TPA: hypothetical protein EYP14_00985, partial [Planctomycetaceae bacterium]|nr:hypothetical protein [Planctomycetaceae bacterium]